MVRLLRDVMGLHVEFEEPTTMDLALPSGDRVQWPRPFTARWRAAGSRSSANRAGGRASAPDASTFRMVDLLLFAFQGSKELLAPLGD